MNRRPHQKVVSIEDMSEQELIEFAKVLEAEMSDDLKPCPFCGGEASKIHASGLFERVYCKDCFAQTGGLHSDRAMAKKAWNTRPADAAIKQLQQALKDQSSVSDRLAEQLEQLVAINEALTAENKRLGQQCEGLMQAGMNNGQALILAEAKLAKAVEALRKIEGWPDYRSPSHQDIARTTLAEIEGEKT